MAGRIEQPESRLRRGRRRLWRPILASLLVHFSLLTWMGLITPRIRPRPNPPSAGPAMEVQLERITPEQRTDEPKSTAARPSPATPPRAPAPPFAPILRRPAEADPGSGAAVPAASSGQRSASAPAGAAAGAATSTGRPAGSPRSEAVGAGTAQDGAGAMRGYGRVTVGCDVADLVRLTPGERDECNQRFGYEARKAPKMTASAMDPLKRATFDDAAQRSCARHFYKTPVPMAVETDRNEERYERRDTIPAVGLFTAPATNRWAFCPSSP